MTNSQKADQLQIKPLDENTRPSTGNNQSADPRVAAFLERLRTKAQAIDVAKQEDHVTAKEPRRRPIVEQASNPDWYTPTPQKAKATASVSFVKRFVAAPRNKAKTG